ncbi:hypothetical protein LshimejAT787_0704400 [Lyophyllum shimeji]|uniref:RNase III domain-containing protein n=1 Tax=Lyophyllum shimeji TaxID=47721 RepID=A0A9P3PNX9_LYOSH|nr:hypothetical protein LshimejAT787_0704400 [Lyophyllum shimeji]
MFLDDIKPAIYKAISMFPWCLPEVRRSCLFMIEDNSRLEAFEYYGDRVLYGLVNELLQERYSNLSPSFSVAARQIIVSNETLGYMMDCMGYGLPGIVATWKAKGDLFEVLVGLYRSENCRDKTMEWARATFIPILDHAASAYWPPFVPLARPPPLPRLPTPLAPTPALPPPRPFPPQGLSNSTQSSGPLPSTLQPSSGLALNQAHQNPQLQQLARTTVGTSPSTVRNDVVFATVGRSKNTVAPPLPVAKFVDTSRATGTKRKGDQTPSPKPAVKKFRRLQLSFTESSAAAMLSGPTSQDSVPATGTLPRLALGPSRVINAASQGSSSTTSAALKIAEPIPRGPQAWLQRFTRKKRQ